MQMKKKVGQEDVSANIHKTMWLWRNPIVVKLEAFLRQKGDAKATTIKKNDENSPRHNNDDEEMQMKLPK